MGVIVRQKTKGKGQPWWVFIHHDGVRRSRKVGDKKTTEAVAARIREKIAAGAFQVAETAPVPPFGEVAERWFAFMTSTGVAEGTLSGYRTILDKHLAPVFGAQRVASITRAQVVDLLMGARAQGYSASHVGIRLVVLNGVFHRAIAEQVMDQTPTVGIKREIRLKVPTPTPEPFDFEGWERLLAIAGGAFAGQEYLAPLLSTAFYAGLRIGELLGLRWVDINFGEKLLTVQRTYHGHGRFGPPKSRKPRPVELADSLVAVLKAHRSRELAKGLRLRGATLPAQVFTDADGRVLCGRHIRRVWEEVLAAAGMPRRKFHTTRATYASLLLMAGADLYWVKEQLGHASIKTLESAYARYIPNQRGTSQVNLLDAPNRILSEPNLGVIKKCTVN